MAIARRLYGLRHDLLPNFPTIYASLDRICGLNGRSVVGDFADNPGGGAPGDSTFFLAALIERGITDAVVGCIHDPAVAAICADAGVEAHLPVRLGGKAGPTSGAPLDLEVEVMAVKEDHDQGVFGIGRQPLGRSAWLRCGGIDIVVCSVRTQVLDPDAFTGLGLTLEGKRVVVVKSSAHYQAGFQACADHLWNVATPGALSLDFASFAYTKRDGDYFPKVADPWAARGEPEAKVFHQAKQRS
jgi:microcystin degradation protein MlrC